MSITEQQITNIRKIMAEEKITIKELSERLNKSQSATSSLLHQKNISLEMLENIYKALNYNIIIQTTKE